MHGFQKLFYKYSNIGGNIGSGGKVSKMVTYRKNRQRGSEPVKLAVFDFDGTLFTKETLPSLGREWLRQKRSPLRYIYVYLTIIGDFLLYKAGLLPREIFKPRAVQRFNALFHQMRQEEIEDFFQRAYPFMKRHFNHNVLAAIAEAKREGYHTVLLSGAYSGLLRAVAADLGIDTVLGAELSYQDGIYDEAGSMAIIDGEEKLNLLLLAFDGTEIDWSASRSYGNSYTDLPVLTAVGRPVAVLPEPRLLEHAREHNWQVMGG